MSKGVTEMDNRLAIRAAVYLAVAAFLTLPAEAQNSTGDPHAHDWYKEQVQGKIDPTTGEKIPQAAGTTATSTNTGSTPPATATPNSATTDILNQSLGGVKPGYHGAHQWYADDQVGLYIAGGLFVIAIIFAAFASRKSKKKSTDQAQSIL